MKKATSSLTTTEMEKGSDQGTFRERLIRSLVGYDFFISYARSEASEYARSLDLELSQKDYTCFFDQSEITAGEKFKVRIQKALNRSKVLLLVSSAEAHKRPYVQFEVEMFLKKRKPICLPISFDGCASSLPWQALKESSWVDASYTDLQKGHPSKATIDAIVNRSKFLKRVLLVRSMVIAIVCILLLITSWALIERGISQRRLAYSLRDRARMEMVTTERRMRAAALLESAYSIEPNSYVGSILLSDALRTMQSRLWSQNLGSLPISLTVKNDVGDVIVVLDDGRIQQRNNTNGLVSWEVVEAGSKKGPSLVDSNSNYIISSSLPDFTLEDFISSNIYEHYSTRLWNIGNQKQVAEFIDGETHPPDALDIGTTNFATLSNDIIRVFSLETGMLIREISAPMSSDLVKVSQKGDYVASYSDWQSQYLIKIWSVSSGKQVAACSTKKEIKNIIFTLTSDAIIFSTDDGIIHVWDIVENSHRFSMNDHQRSVTDFALTPNNNLLASSSWDTSIRLWNIRTGKLVRTLVGHTDKVTSIDYNANGKLLVSTGQDGLVILWNVSTGTASLVIDSHQGEVLDACITENDRYIYTCGEDKVLAKWDISRAVGLIRFPKDDARHSTPYISHLGDYGVYFGPDDTPELIHFESGRKVPLNGHSTKSINGVALERNSLLFAGRDDSGKATIWDVQSGNKKITLQGDEYHKNIHLLSFAPSGEVVAGIYADGYCRIWDVRNGAILKEAQMHYDLSEMHKYLRLSSILTFNPQGTLLMSGALSVNPFIWKWQEEDSLPEGLESKQKRYGTFDVQIGMTNAIVFSPKGDLLAIGGGDDDPILQLWEVSDKGSILNKRLLNGHSMFIRCLAFANNGKLLASGSRDGSVKIWNTDSGILQTSLVNHKAEITSLAFHPAGNLVATGSADGIVRIWDVGTSDILLKKACHIDKVLQLEFARDGNMLISSGEDGQVVQWELKQNLPSFKEIQKLMNQQATWRVVDELLVPQTSILQVE